MLLKQTLIAKLQKQQELFTKLYTSRNVTVMISFELSHKILKKKGQQFDDVFDGLILSPGKS